jgi:ubiquinone/menaquinone biosynthesis C-methylase UbiE
MLSEKNVREKEFHNKLQSKSRGRFENIFYKAIYNANEDFFDYLKINSADSYILDYGCGIGQSLQKVIKFHPKKIVGIDISEVSIQKAKDSIQKSNSNVELLVDNCEKTKFSDNTFDIIYGAGILHHLDISLCLKELHRVLKPGGRFLFIEPLGTNPLINFYRKLTPHSRSKDEHPLINRDFQLIRNSFSKLRIKYYGFFTLIFFPIYTAPRKSLIFKILKKVDQFLFKFEIFKKFAWSVLIIAEKN